MKSWWRLTPVVLSGLSLVFGGSLGCSAPGGPGAFPSTSTTGPRDAGPSDVPTMAVSVCTPVRASEDLSGRASLMGIGDMPSGVPGVRSVQVSALYAQFSNICGRCHVSTTNGGMHTTEATFVQDVDEIWLAAIESDDPAAAMPPEGKAFSSRPDGDPVRQLATYLEAWMIQGRPSDSFVIEDDAGGSTAATAYAYAAMTNLGTCIPSRDMYAASPSGEMEVMDQMFADATELPRTLAETDLTTFDSDVLAAKGVIAFVPTYPLYSDGSGKLRHIRVPKGESVRFDRQNQTFEIPPNTRFYKTFFRKVIDGTGHLRNRKMETRLILARPDTVDADGKTPLPTALYGTYLWNEDETEAALSTDVTYRDGTGFADRILEYATNEIDYRQLLESLGPGSATNATTRRREALKQHPGLVRHYAVPGAQRCVQCHQGSPVKSFVLGFTPLQVARRTNATAGSYEPTGDDELTQLKRLIDYGVITGMSSPAEVVKLEDSQLPRTARTPEELNAQAYMVGNCAHCHNPRGFPSLAKPELSPVLNFLPSAGADGGGVFEFPLDRVSPVRARGANGDIPIPYITPSLRDYPVADANGRRMDDGAMLGEASGSTEVYEQTWTPKYNQELEFAWADLDHKKAFGARGCATAPLIPSQKVYCGTQRIGHTFVAAPWRSLIYRNVDAPFPYVDDYVPFPHMPMNSPGFDCRVPRLMGSWMVSIPAVRKRPDISEDALPYPGVSKPGDGSYDDSPQPYTEVKRDDAGYAAAQAAAKSRLAEYQNGIRYKYCQDVFGADILDPIGKNGFTATDPLPPRNYLPDPGLYIVGTLPPYDPNHPGEFIQPNIGVPYHTHWFAYDPTNAGGQWQPRRSDVWKRTLVDGEPDEAPPAGEPNLNPEEATSRRRVAEAVSEATLTPELQKYATTEIPYGVWESKPGCESKLGAVRKAATFTGAERAAWMDNAASGTKPDSPVFMMSPGGALYRHICFNCHGPKADGHGIQADALASSSEGQARPADFMSGLFGPLDSPGANLLRVFGTANGEDKPDMDTALQWAARYMPWMALGGTLQLIPKDIIHQVQATRILGQRRPNAQFLPDVGVSANMLNLAKGLCSIMLPDLSVLHPDLQDATNFIATGFGKYGDAGYPLFLGKYSPFIAANGDAEMWMNLCTRFSPPVVRVYGFYPDRSTTVVAWKGFLKALYYADGSLSHDPATKGMKLAYPIGAPVGNHKQQTVAWAGADAAPINYYPACIQRPSDLMPGEGASEVPPDDIVAALVAKALLPYCPADFIRDGSPMWQNLIGDVNPANHDEAEIDNVREWALRGAISAGMSVFTYLRAADLSHKQPLYYNQCPMLP